MDGFVIATALRWRWRWIGFRIQSFLEHLLVHTSFLSINFWSSLSVPRFMDWCSNLDDYESRIGCLLLATMKFFVSVAFIMNHVWTSRYHHEGLDSVVINGYVRHHVQPSCGLSRPFLIQSHSLLFLDSSCYKPWLTVGQEIETFLSDFSSVFLSVISIDHTAAVRLTIVFVGPTVSHNY